VVVMTVPVIVFFLGGLVDNRRLGGVRLQTSAP